MASCSLRHAAASQHVLMDFSATMAVPSAERLREKNLLPLCDGKSEVWGYFRFLQHKDNQTTDLSKVVIVETLAGSLLS